MLGHKHIRDLLSNIIVNLNVIALACNSIVRDLGVIFDKELSFNLHEDFKDGILSPL